MTEADYAVPGFDATGYAADIKKDGALDLALITSPSPCRAAAVFTQNAFPAAPVEYDRALLAANPAGIHGVVINSGNANACTGSLGSANTRLTAEAVEEAISAPDHTVFVMSTGVIGVQLPVDKLIDAMPAAIGQLQPDGWASAAQAIMTTDTRPKLVTRTVQVNDIDVHITGIAKGAGMIHPNMATMLSVIATDATISQPILQQALSEAADVSFNRISIDGDTSTNDTVLLLANGVADNAEIVDANSDAYQCFRAALDELSIELAQAIVRDGEGATKFVTLMVEGAIDNAEAHQAANTVATSPLVKTAFYGNDANWGRLLMAVGRAGITVEPTRCHLFIGHGENELQLVDRGQPTDYEEVDAAAIFAQEDIVVRVDLGLGSGEATVWTSDLSHDYVSINADYRT